MFAGTAVKRSRSPSENQQQHETCHPSIYGPEILSATRFRKFMHDNLSNIHWQTSVKKAVVYHWLQGDGDRKQGLAATDLLSQRHLADLWTRE